MKRPISMLDVVVFLMVAFAIIIGGLVYVKAPPAIVLLTAGVTLIIMAIMRGIQWKDIEKDIFDTMQKILLPALILLAVGMLIGAWMISGTIPLIINYGLLVLQPSIFLIAALLICSITSILTGTSWGTIGTVGIALMGVSTGLGIPTEYTAAAIITGAFFGDKLSPLSDSTIIASALTEVNLIEHIKHLLSTTMPGYVISIFLFVILGFQLNEKQYETGNESVVLITGTLQDSFHLNPLLLLPPLLVLVLVFKRSSPLPVFMLGIITACVLAVAVQGSSLADIAKTLSDGYVGTTGVEIVDSMLSQGGLQSMFSTVMIFFASSILAAPLKTTGILQLMIDTILKKVKSSKAMMTCSLFLHGGFYCVTGNFSSSYAVMGPILSPLYDKYGLHRKNLSRSLEDTGTAIGPGIPWGISAVFIMNTLNVSVSQYILITPIIYTGVIFALIYIYTGFSIARNNTVPIEALPLKSGSSDRQEHSKSVDSL
ncbi:Na+/H+ antiporter NhaC [Metabacillus arenae]|uniref:Na+/H+ antiporter NhaC n=1 Tax=Metabacillus arenae TaxID=2771434 RepID=A0A926NLT3_9BACI|nr:Na+/H+ antiporter NhaC [Metabacillus arenae]MBD1382313.1 Na+/H+ antiporter NhaC [Metabacillus arenae]